MSRVTWRWVIEFYSLRSSKKSCKSYQNRTNCWNWKKTVKTPLLLSAAYGLIATSLVCAWERVLAQRPCYQWVRLTNRRKHPRQKQEKTISSLNLTSTTAFWWTLILGLAKRPKVERPYNWNIRSALPLLPGPKGPEIKSHRKHWNHGKENRRRFCWAESPKARNRAKSKQI